jgi:hypothetical protein
MYEKIDALINISYSKQTESETEIETIMYFINVHSKIIKMNAHSKQSEITNGTEFIPLRICSNIIMLSNYKLYTIKNHALCEIMLENCSDYIIDSCDFTDKFAKINSEYYVIDIVPEHISLTSPSLLRKIPDLILAKNSANITITIHKEIYYHYVDTNNNLILVKKSATKQNCVSDVNEITILDSNISLLLNCNVDVYGINIIYIKSNTIFCSIYSDTTLLQTYTIDWNNVSIKKNMHKFLLGSDDKLYQFICANSKYKLYVVATNVYDFNCHCVRELYAICKNGDIYYKHISQVLNTRYSYNSANYHFSAKIYKSKSAMKIITN